MPLILFTLSKLQWLWLLLPPRHALSAALGHRLLHCVLLQERTVVALRVALQKVDHYPTPFCLQASKLATSQSLSSLQDWKRCNRRLINKNTQQKNLYTGWLWTQAKRQAKYLLLSLRRAEMLFGSWVTR